MTLTPEQLAMVAKGLGGQSLHKFVNRDAWWMVAGANTGLYIGSDGDLLLAILNRAAELGYQPALDYDGVDWWSHALTPGPIGIAGDALAALLDGFSQLPECQPEKNLNNSQLYDEGQP